MNKLPASLPISIQFIFILKKIYIYIYKIKLQNTTKILLRI